MVYDSNVIARHDIFPRPCFVLDDKSGLSHQCTGFGERVQTMILSKDENSADSLNGRIVRGYRVVQG